MTESEPHDHIPAESEISEEDKLMAILAYVPVLCLLPYSRRDRTEFVSRHVRLGMTLFVIEVIALLLRYLRVVWDLVILLCVVGAVIGIVHVVKGKPLELPYLTDILSRRWER